MKRRDLIKRLETAGYRLDRDGDHAIYEKSTALVLCAFGGYLGLHQFYIGKIGKGFLYMFTAGLFCIGWSKDNFGFKRTTVCSSMNVSNPLIV